VGANMYSQGTSLDEALATPTVGAGIRPLVGVYPIMPLKVRLAVEALIARLPIALKRTSGRLILDKLKELHGWCGRGDTQGGRLSVMMRACLGLRWRLV
jgi:hypothetical protein